MHACKKMTCYFDNYICHQNCYCDMALGWCKISPLWQSSMGNAEYVEYSNNNSALQRSLPL